MDVLKRYAIAETLRFASVEAMQNGVSNLLAERLPFWWQTARVGLTRYAEAHEAGVSVQSDEGHDEPFLAGSVLSRACLRTDFPWSGYEGRFARQSGLQLRPHTNNLKTDVAVNPSAKPREPWEREYLELFADCFIKRLSADAVSSLTDESARFLSEIGLPEVGLCELRMECDPLRVWRVRDYSPRWSRSFAQFGDHVRLGSFGFSWLLLGEEDQVQLVHTRTGHCMFVNSSLVQLGRCALAWFGAEGAPSSAAKAIRAVDSAALEPGSFWSETVAELDG